MSCDSYREQWTTALVAGEDPSPEVAAHVAGCAECERETRELARVWSDLGELAEEAPSDELRLRFDGMLQTWQSFAAERSELTAARPPANDASPAAVTPLRRPRRRGLQRQLYRLGYGLAALLAGVAIGVLATGTGHHDEVAEVRAEMRDMRQVLALSLLQQSTATGRLQGVSMSAEVARQNPQVLAALLDTLTNESNPNVRLAVIDALASRAGEPAVQQRMGMALRREEEPLVQIALADALLAADGERARRLVEPLLESKQARPEVRKYLQQRLASRI